MCSLTNFSKNRIFFLLFEMVKITLDILLNPCTIFFLQILETMQQSSKNAKKREINFAFEKTFFLSTFKAKLGFFPQNS